jgi:glycosyltransferase involved in cell wall biosynthesis
MNVGLVIYGSLDSLSGGYRYDRELVRRLESRGASVRLFSQPWRSYALRLAASLDRDFRRRIERARLDVILEDELNHPSLLTMRSGSDLPPRVSIVHHLRSSERHPLVAKALYRQVERHYLDGVDAFICNSDTTASVVRETSVRPRPLVVAKPGGREIENAPSAEEVLARTQKPPLRILFVGQLTPRKGLHVLLDAVGTMPSGQWRLDVVGDLEADPRYSRRCKALARSLEGAVQFHGHLDGAALDACYRKAHVLCVPSQYEGYGIVYQEAQQYGLPAIGTEGGAAREIVEDGRTGFIVAVESRKAVARALARLADREFLASMSVRALERARTLPTWGETMDRAVDFVQEIVALHQRGRRTC